MTAVKKLDLDEQGRPRSFVVGPHRWRFDWSEDAQRDLRQEGIHARAYILQHRVVIDDYERPHTAVAESMVHEILHAVWATAGLYEEGNPDSEEILVTRMAPLLLHVWRASPEVVAFLLADDDVGA